MCKIVKSTAILIYAIATIEAAHAADIADKQNRPPVFASIPLEVEVGSRYWLSNGSYVGNLYDSVVTSQMNSRLTYNNMTGHSAEAFFRVEHETGVFVKGFLGGGTLASGKMNDEDFPPEFRPHSNTISVQSGGSLKYLTVDLGYDFLHGNASNGLPYKIGAFIGYNNYHERFNTFGCYQVSSNPGICGVPYATNADGLDEVTSWNSMRVGLGGEATLLPGIRASLEGAWLRNWYYGTDYHNRRANIRGTSETGSGQGAQVEGILSFDITRQFSLGIGGRYWLMNASALAHWEQLPVALTDLRSNHSSPLGVYSQTYGGFLQASYRFGGANEDKRGNLLASNFGKSDDSSHNWAGTYLGGNVAYGFGNSGVTNLSPTTEMALLKQYMLYVPTTMRADMAGFSGGGQIGYNYKLNSPVVLGIETDMSYANIGGSVGIPSIVPSYNNIDEVWTNAPVDSSSKSLLTWYGTARLRSGYLIRDDMMLYGTAGIAYGGISANAIVQTAFSDYTTAAIGQYNATQVGWTAGAGFEYAVAKNWSLKAEWLYLGFGDQKYALNPVYVGVPYAYNVTINNDTHVIRTGVNYRLDLN